MQTVYSKWSGIYCLTASSLHLKVDGSKSERIARQKTYRVVCTLKSKSQIRAKASALSFSPTSSIASVRRTVLPQGLMVAWDWGWLLSVIWWNCMEALFKPRVPEKSREQHLQSNYHFWKRAGTCHTAGKNPPLIFSLTLRSRPNGFLLMLLTSSALHYRYQPLSLWLTYGYLWLMMRRIHGIT